MYPMLTATPVSRQTMEVFAGYNHNVRIAEGEFYDMRNLSSDNAPVLAPRRKRGIYAAVQAQGMIAKDSLCYIDGQYFVMNEYRIDMGLSTKQADCPKQLVSMGAYVLIFPDRKYINTADTADRGSIDAQFQTVGAVTFSPCKLDGTEYKPEYIQPSPPEKPANMALWMDTSTTPHSLKQWSEGTGMWVSVATTYVKIHSAGIGRSFKQYDGVKITGLKSGIQTMEGSPRADIGQLEALEGAAVLYGAGDDYLVVVGILDSQTTIENQITISRKMPLTDYVTECDNRLWGCRYGLNENGEVVNELYACKLGDFKNWNCFMGISTDSYAVSLGSDGPFTGAITHAGHPLFFKENCLHKVFGQIPANFQVQSSTCRGVQKGCSRSLSIVNEVLYYKSQHAVCAYDGSLPTEISTALGEVAYHGAVAQAHGNKYYISMKDSQEVPSLFVYDTAKNLWHREDELPAYLLCSCREELYCATTDGKILTLLGSGDEFEKEVQWMCQTGIITAQMPENKYLRRLNIRMVLEVGSHMEVKVQYDSTGVWEPLALLTGSSLRSFTIPVRPRRCDHLRLRLEGNGKCMVFSVTKSIAGGSDTVND